MALAFVVLACFILLGIVFDIIGVAVTAADERPFHSMAAHRTPGAREALGLIRKANKVSSFCNDVVGFPFFSCFFLLSPVSKLSSPAFLLCSHSVCG